MNKAMLGGNARKVVRRPAYATSGVAIGVHAIASLIYDWITPVPALTLVVSETIPVVVIAYLAVVFTTAVRTKP
jgi:hypothetical protein